MSKPEENSKQPLIVIENLQKAYKTSGGTVQVLEDISFKLYQGEIVVVMGPSGCGKTTLLNLIGGLDNSDNGIIRVRGVDITQRSDTELSRMRNRDFGIVFQDFNLLTEMTVFQNIEFPLVIARIPKKERKTRVMQLIKKVGLKEKENHKEKQLSGGEKQRVAIARALVNNPTIILLDEPTGDLDLETSKEVIQLLKDLVKTKKCTLFVITHDEYIASQADRKLILKDGRIYDERT